MRIKVTKIPSWAEAVAEWVAVGRPVRSEEEIANIYRIFCSTCPLFHRDTCRECDCNVRKEGWAIFNKIKMATQHCNKGYW
jgi:hypothetical protein